MKNQRTMLSAAEARTVADRLAILEAWRACRAALPWMNESQATRAVLACLPALTGQRSSRATLYNWRRRYAGGGYAAVVDGRSASLRRQGAKAQARGRLPLSREVRKTA